MDAYGMVYVIFEILIALVAVIINLYVLIAINCTSKRHRTVANRFVTSLAFADMSVGLIGIPCSIFVFYGLLSGDYESCILLNTVNIVLTGMSVFCILSIAIERYIAIKHPYSYRAGFIGQHPVTIISMTWALGVFSGMVPIFGWAVPPPDEPERCFFMKTIDITYMVYLRFFIFHLVPMIVIPSMYIYIYLIVRKQSDLLCKLDVHSVHNDRQRRKIRRQRHAARSLIILVVVFFACWLPIDIQNTLIVFGHDYLDPGGGGILIALLFSHVNSAINPFIYAFTNKHVRKSMKKMLGQNVRADFITETCVRSSDINSTTKSAARDTPTTFKRTKSANHLTALVGNVRYAKS